jgi:hypothetical protein
VALAPFPRDGQDEAARMIRIGMAAWRVAPRPQRMVIRRTTVTAARDGEGRQEQLEPKSQDASTTRR